MKEHKIFYSSDEGTQNILDLGVEGLTVSSACSLNDSLGLMSSLLLFFVAIGWQDIYN